MWSHLYDTTENMSPIKTAITHLKSLKIQFCNPFKKSSKSAFFRGLQNYLVKTEKFNFFWKVCKNTCLTIGEEENSLAGSE